MDFITLETPTQKKKMKKQLKLKLIIPGRTYPSSVEIMEKDGNRILFLLQSYVVGMYCAIHFNNETIHHQTGDHNNKTFVSKLKKDIAKALERGAIVTLGTIRDIQE